MTAAALETGAARGAPGMKTFPTRYGRAIAQGWIVIALTFGGLGAWSMLAPLGSAAIAPGTVVVDGARKSVQHLEGGIVREILVRDGDAVTAGQPLVRLDETLQRGTLELILGRLDADRAYEARLIAERDGLAAIAFPADLLQRAGASAEVARMLAGQTGIFQARQASLTGQASILQNRIQQSEAQIAGLAKEQASKARQADLMRSELDGQKRLLGKGYAAKNRVLAVERELEDLLGASGAIDSQIAGIRQAIGESQLQIVQLRKTFLENVEGELRQTQTEIFDLSQRADTVRKEIGRLAVTAPVGGTVVDLAVHTVGGVVAPGSRILDIVPREDELIVEAHLQPVDIDDVGAGRVAQVRFPAFKRSTTPTIYGTVKTVSADRIVDARTNAAYYLVRVSVPKEERRKLTDLDLVPGMPAEVVLPKADHTVVDYLVAPLEDTVVKAFRE